MTIIKRRKPIPAPAAPVTAPVTVVRAKPTPLRKAIDPNKRDEIVLKLKAIGNENEYQTDGARVEARYLARIHNPMSAIRARCVQCCCGQPGEVAKCTATGCALHPFRMGVNPYNKRVRERLEGSSTNDQDDQDNQDDGDSGEEE